MDSKAETFHDLSFFIRTFGCQMNKHDSERVVGILEALGASEVSSPEQADIVIYMTCCVRRAADERLFGQINSIKNLALRDNTPLSRRIIALGGCIAQRDKETLFDEIPHLDVVFGPENIGSLPALIQNALKDNSRQIDVSEQSSSFSSDLDTHRKYDWAAWLPITIGCNNFCSYCIVPYVRGRERSRPFEDICAEARKYVDQGVKEITLLGQNVNSYGRDLYGQPRFAEILEAVASRGIARLRFATSHPKDLSDEVIAQFGQLNNLMPALHLPVQAGSDRILKAMRRKYTSKHYLELIDKLRATCPDIALSTDIIVGFPGEDEQDFQATLELVDKVGYTQVFSFIYSPRKGTKAATMKEVVDREVCQERFDRLIEVVAKRALEVNQVDNNKTVEVLFEGLSKKDSSLLTGKTPKNQTIHAHIPDKSHQQDFVGHIVPVHIDEVKTWYLKGTIQ